MKPNKIYLYERKDGSKGAEYDILAARRRGKILEIFSISSVEVIQELLSRPLDGRVRALAERALIEKGGEIPLSIESVPEVQPKAIIPIKITWWDRIKGIFS